MQMHVIAGNRRRSHHYTTNISASQDWTRAQQAPQITEWK